MRKLILSASIFTSIIALTTAQAAPINIDPYTGLYTGVNLGYAQTTQGIGDFQNQPFAYGINVGYLVDVADDTKAGIEFNANSMGDLKASKLDLADGGSKADQYHAYNIGLGLAGQYQVVDNVYLEGMVGLAWSYGRLKFTSPIQSVEPTINLSASRIHPAVKLGAGYQLTPRLAAHADFNYLGGDNYFEADDTTPNKLTPLQVSAFFTGLTYNF